MRRAIPHLVLACVIGMIMAVSGHLFSVLGRPPTAMDKKISEADRVLCYRLLEGRSATFRLSGSEQVLKLVSHVILTNTPLAENGSVDYGVAFELRSPEGELLWEREVFTRSRQSKADYQDGMWMKENAFSLAGGVEVTDDRVLLVTLPDRIPVNSELRLSKLGSPHEVAVRVYERKERTPLERRIALQSLYPSERDSLIARTTFEPWVLVPEWEQLQRLRYRFERVAAIGDVNVDFLTRPIWYTGFRNSPDHLDTSDASETLSVSSRQVTSSWLVLTPSAEALDIPVVLKGTPEDRLFRISARAVGPSVKDISTTEAPSSGAALHVEFLDDAGKPVAEEIGYPVDRPPSSHDYFERDGGEVAQSSEVASLRFIAPTRASTVRLKPRGGPIAARVFVYSPPIKAPSSSPETSRWFELSLHTQAPHESQSITLRGQKPVEAPPSSEPVASVYRSLRVPKNAGRRTLLEPVSPDDLSRFLAGGWPSSAWVSVEGRLPFFSDGKTRTTLRYLVASKDSGKRVTIAVDGDEVASTYAVAPGGSIRLGVLPRGRHVLQVSTPPRSFRALLSDAPTSTQDATIWRAREVYPIGPRGLEIPFDLKENDRRISAILFAPHAMTPEGSMIELELDGGNPRRLAGRPIARYTEARRMVSLPDSLAQASLFFPVGTEAGYQRVVSVPLGDDIAPGTHILHIRSTGKDHLWASFFVTEDAVPERASVSGSSSAY